MNEEWRKDFIICPKKNPTNNHHPPPSKIKTPWFQVACILVYDKRSHVNEWLFQNYNYSIVRGDIVYNKKEYCNYNINIY